MNDKKRARKERLISRLKWEIEHGVLYANHDNDKVWKARLEARLAEAKVGM